MHCVLEDFRNSLATRDALKDLVSSPLATLSLAFAEVVVLLHWAARHFALTSSIYRIEIGQHCASVRLLHPTIYLHFIIRRLRLSFLLGPI